MFGSRRVTDFATASEEFVGEQGDVDPVTEKLNELSDEVAPSTGTGSEAGRRLIESGAWEW